jgi:hypothetical protein
MSNEIYEWVLDAYRFDVAKKKIKYSPMPSETGRPTWDMPPDFTQDWGWLGEGTVTSVFTSNSDLDDSSEEDWQSEDAQ